MKKVLTLTLALLLVLSAAVPVFAAESEEWTCPSCGSTVTGNFCSNCGAPKQEEETSSIGEKLGGILDKIAEATSHAFSSIDPSPDKYTWYIKDYVGQNLAAVGYTSLGGDRLDAYGAGYLKLILVTQDGTYVDFNNEDLYDGQRRERIR